MSEADKSGCAEVPFIEQLRGLPVDYRVAREIQWASDGTPTGYQFIPVGFMFHRAADELTKLRERAELAEKDMQDAFAHRDQLHQKRMALIARAETAEAALSSSRAREAMLSALLKRAIEDHLEHDPIEARENCDGCKFEAEIRAALYSTETKP